MAPRTGPSDGKAVLGRPGSRHDSGDFPQAVAQVELFGHRRGAFTGATRNREGLVRAAEGGALFLDEIGDLDVGLQARLLRVLQENSVLPVGEEREVAVNVRFIAATNQDLEGLVARRKFRADLFHRLCVLRLEIPPLRERPSDLELLIEHFIRRHHNVKGQARPAANADFVRALRQLELPGNARQVENLVCLALANHHDEGELSLSDLPAAVLGQLADAVDQGAVHLSSATTPSQDGLQQLAPDQMCESVILERAGWNLSRAMNEFERRVLAIAMERVQGNQSEAARLLGINRRSVYKKLNKHYLLRAYFHQP